MQKRNLFLIALSSLCGLALAGCGGNQNSSETADGKAAPGSGETLYLSAIPDGKITDQKTKFNKLAEYLSGKLGVPTEFLFSKDYADSVTKFKNGEVQLVWFGGLSGVQARLAVPGAKAIAQGAEDPTYQSYLIANKTTGLQPSVTFPIAIKEMTFTFGSPGSTSGRLMPAYYIMQNTGGVAPDLWFTQKPGFQLSGGHVATANAVADGTYQVGAINYKTYDELVSNNPKIAENTIRIWTTPPYADYNFTIHPEVETLFGEGFIAKVQAALIETPADSDALKAINRTAIIAAKNEDYDGIKKTAVELELLNLY